MSQTSVLRTALLVPLLLASLSGCSWFRDKDEDKANISTVSVTTAPDFEVTARLAEAAQRTATAIENLASIEQARTPELYTPVVNDAPEELRLLLTVQWTGPWENLLKVMAQRVGYGFRALGKAPTTPIIVTVDAKQEPFVDVMRSVGLQAAGRADLVLDSQNRFVEVRYAPDTGR